MVFEKGDINLGTDNWNVADGYTKIKILKQLIFLDRFDTIAQICERCNKEDARIIYNNQKLCEGCLYYVKGELKISREYMCVVCKKKINTALKPIIPLCSKRCRDEFEKRLKCFEDAFERVYGVFGDGGEDGGQ